MLDKPRVLIVDDEMSIRRSMRLILRKEFDVTAVESGFEAVALIEKGAEFDVACLDLRMPGMPGIEAMKQIKQLNPTTEVLIATGYADIESAKNALKLGAYDYIDKPVEVDLLRASIHKGVERKRQSVASRDAKDQLELAKAKLVESERLSAIAQLITGVTHELSNPLAIILGFSDLLLQENVSPEQTKSSLEYIHQNALECEKVLRQLTTFACKQKAEREYLQINKIIERTLEVKQHQFKVAGIQIVSQLSEQLPGTMVDAYQLQQVFLNILNNAQYAMRYQGDSGKLTVKSEHTGQVIRIHFTDTGPGIPKENLQKIFHPFFSTKPQEESVGLGLSVSYEIVQEHGGEIYVASEIEKGACFIVELPVVEMPSFATAFTHNAAEVEQQNVFVISHQKATEELLCTMLQTLGHHVEASHDEAAIKHALSDESHQILFCEVHPPEINVRQIYETWVKIHPGLQSRFVFLVDDRLDEATQEFIDQVDGTSIRKPLRMHALEVLLRKIIDLANDKTVGEAA